VDVDILLLLHVDRLLHVRRALAALPVLKHGGCGTLALVQRLLCWRALPCMVHHLVTLLLYRGLRDRRTLAGTLSLKQLSLGPRWLLDKGQEVPVRLDLLE